MALAHSPLNPKDVHEVKAGWLDEKTEYIDGFTVSYGFVLSYRNRWVYIWGKRFPHRQRFDHAFQYFDEEPTHLYTRNRNWEYNLTGDFDGTAYQEATGQLDSGSDHHVNPS